MSVDRDQPRGDAAAFAQQDVVGADRRRRCASTSTDDLQRCESAARSASGMIQASRPAPIRNRPMSSASANTGASAASVDVGRLRRPARPRCRSAGTAASRDATCRRSGSRPCRRPRSARGCGRCGARRAAKRQRLAGAARRGAAAGVVLGRVAADADAEIDQDRRGDEDRRVGADQHHAEHHGRGEAVDRLAAEEAAAPARPASRSRG